MGQIFTEYERTLRLYGEAIDEIIARARVERARINRSIEEGHRFQQSHDVLHCARDILAVEAKLQIFSNLSFTKEM